jgi:type VI secretion system secreted protein VgrG
MIFAACNPSRYRLEDSRRLLFGAAGPAAHPRVRIRAPAILEPVRLSGREGVNSLFEYELLLKTPDALNLGASGAADFDLDSFIGREISCTIQLDGAGEFIAGAIGRRSTASAPACARSTPSSPTRAVGRRRPPRPVQAHPAPLAAPGHAEHRLQDLPEQDGGRHPGRTAGRLRFPVDKRLTASKTYPQRDYQTQFNESDFAFFERLCQEWGISYHFEHSEGKHRLVLIDNMGAYKPSTKRRLPQVEYHAPGWKIDAEYIHSFVPHNQAHQRPYTTRDYDYTRPSADLSVERSDPRPTGQADQEVYQWHAGQAGSHYAAARRHRRRPTTRRAKAANSRCCACRRCAPTAHAPRPAATCAAWCPAAASSCSNIRARRPTPNT